VTIPDLLYFFVYFSILGFLLGFSIIISSLAYSLIKGAPYVPTRKRRILEILNTAKLTPSDTFLELGSGDGTVILHAARLYKVTGRGVEINMFLVWLSRLKTWLLRIPGVTFTTANALEAPFESFNVVYVFLFPKILDKLAPVILKKARPGTLVISHGFRIDAFDSKLEKKLEDKPFSTYYYRL
jgi:SAM-dependent methyltransferase